MINQARIVLIKMQILLFKIQRIITEIIIKLLWLMFLF